MRLKRGLVLMLLLIMLGSVTAVITAATSAVTVVVPVFWEMLFDASILDEFETQYGVRVEIVYTDDLPFVEPTDADSLAQYLDVMERYISRGDVVQISTESLRPEVTRAGFFLNLAPLINADPNLNSADFYTAVWESFQWEGGHWGIPFAARAVLISYIQEAFDRASVTYPSEVWSIDEFADAARRVTEYDNEGNITLPAVMSDNAGVIALIASLVGDDFYDDGSLLDQPDFSNSLLPEILDELAELQAEGIFGQGFNERFQEIPIQLGEGGGVVMITVEARDDEGGSLEDDEPELGFQMPERTLAPLPGGHSVVQAQGFAVSSGTTQPQIAYELAKFLSEHIETANAAINYDPARQTLTGAAGEDDESEDGVTIFTFESERTLEEQSLVDFALNTGMPASEMRYSNYLVHAFDLMGEGMSAVDALQEAEATAVDALQTAAQRAETTNITVATPAPEVVLAPGEIALNFGLSSFVRPVPYQNEWDQLISEFVASDAQVGLINLNAVPGSDDSITEQNDCFYQPDVAIESLNLDTIIALDPLVNADSRFDRDDVVGNLLTQLERNDQLWGLPLTIQPEMMRYNPALFEAAGVPEPVNGWTIDEFAFALEVLRNVIDADAASFTLQTFGSNYLLMLMAAQGAVVLDYHSDPVRVDLTSPQAVSAIRRILDLAKAGDIAYRPLSREGGFSFITLDEIDQMPVYATSANEVDVRLGDDETPVTRVTTYPYGSDYQPVAYSFGAGFISSQSQHVDACYRWLKYIAQNSPRFGTMPVYQSVIDNLSADVSPDQTALYQQMAAALDSSNVVEFPSGRLLLLSQWIHEAFDAYVLDDADLETVLQTAQANVDAYQACAASIPEFDPATQTRRAYNAQFEDCAESVSAN